MVWGDYGRMDKKTFMGVVQIVIDDLDLSNIVIGWYKLFHTSSVITLPTSGRASNSLMSTSMESFS
jgi:regulating synaptic membrane exocytosis protein 2